MDNPVRRSLPGSLATRCKVLRVRKERGVGETRSEDRAGKGCRIGLGPSLAMRGSTVPAEARKHRDHSQEGALESG